MPLRFDADYRDPAVAWDPLTDEVFGELTSTFIAHIRRHHII
jgi:hypothetical protein